MAETYRRTRVEDLDREHPGLEEFVRSGLASGSPLSEICADVRSKFGVALAISTLQSFWQRRFAPDLEAQKRTYQNARARADLLLDLSKQGDRDASEIVKLIVRSQILEKGEELAHADALDLVKLDLRRTEGEGRMEIERGKLSLERERQQTERERLQLEREKFEASVKQALDEAENEAETKSREGQPQSPAEIVDSIRQRVWGLGPRTGEPQPVSP